MKSEVSAGRLFIVCQRAVLAAICVCLAIGAGPLPAAAGDKPAGEQAGEILLQQSTEKSDRAGLRMSPNQAMWAALAFEDSKQLATLLEKGADPNAAEEISLMTPLMVAEKAEIARLLLEAGADANGKDKLDRTVTHHAVKMAEAATIVRMLGNAGAKIDLPASGIADMTPLLCAVEHYIEGPGREEITLVIRILAHLGANLEAVDSAGRSALAIAAAYNQPKLIRLLIELGADPQRVAANGKTPLDYAREAKAEDAIHELASTQAGASKAN